jgi:fatty-acyl-CoA synthase
MSAKSSLTLSRLLIEAIRRHGDRPAIRQAERTVSYRELDRQSDRLAAFLCARGISRGDHVALHLRNCIEYAVADLAILKIGAVKVPLNEFMAESELAYCLTHSNTQAMISHPSLPCPRPDQLTNLRVHVELRDGLAPAGGGAAVPWEEALERECGPIDVLGEATDAALVMYTGGTTGHPKGVQHSQGGLAINILAHVVCTDIRADEVMLLATPLPHSGGFYLQACLLQGGCVVLGPKFDAQGFLQLACAERATWTFAVPTMIYRLLDAAAAGATFSGSLRTFVYGAAPMDPIRLKQALCITGPVFIQIYGQTECPNLITTLTKSDHLQPALHASCGRAVPFLELRLRNEDGSPISPGAVGEVEVRAPYQLCEYFADAQATGASVVEGWLRTGDLAYQNGEGYLFLVDRTKDMIITGGLNVYSVEVEAALRENPGVRDVAVIGVPDSDWGEAVVAIVVRHSTIDPELLLRQVRLRLSAYKVPKRVVFVEALPLTRYGKPDKKMMRKMALDLPN